MDHRSVNRARVVAAAAFVVVVLISAVGGCARRTNYAWGSYQDALYTMTVQQGSFDPAKDAQVLSEQVRKAKAEGHVPGPGIQAHLGYLHAMAGDSAGAAGWFAAEKQDFPESAVFIDGMLARMQK